MKITTLIFILLIVSILSISFKQAEAIKLVINGKEVKDKISLKETGKIEIVLPEGWRYISGKVKIVNNDEQKTSQQVVGEKGLQEFDLLKFIKLNAVSGNHLVLELSVRTKESGTLSTMKIPIE